ncbi:hypothetical protein PMAYCL1PPCAC_12260, partial [Pristionchus mayeri]
MPHRRLSDGTVYRVADQAAGHCQEVHKIGYIHRDVKPNNNVHRNERSHQDLSGIHWDGETVHHHFRKSQENQGTSWDSEERPDMLPNRYTYRKSKDQGEIWCHLYTHWY